MYLYGVIMIDNDHSSAALATELGSRLKQARLNQDMTQAEVAARAGISRKSVVNAEQGKVQLEVFIALLAALDLTGQLERFLPRQEISPLQLVKLMGKQRRRASGLRKTDDEEPGEW